MRAALLLLLGPVLLLSAGDAAHGQAALDEQRARLREAREDAAEASRRAEALDRQAASAADEARRAAAERGALTARIAASEADLASARARVAILDALREDQRRRLAANQAPIARLIAALQSLARRPAALGIAQPGSLRDTVHVRAVLGTVMPVVEARGAAVRAELDRARTLARQEETAIRALADGRARLDRERLALVALEARHRLRSTALSRGALVESDRAIALGERSRELVAQMDETELAAVTAANLAGLPGPLPRPADQPDEPAARRPPAYLAPVAGRLATGFGELGAGGVRSRGLTFATFAGSRVSAPAAGRVIYAGEFRSYGAIVILDHGDGWSSLVTGLSRLSVSAGRQVAQGEALGEAMRGDDPRVTIELRRRGRPVDAAAMLG